MSAAETHPSDTGFVVRLGAGGAELVRMRWGWEPHQGGEPVINIRAEQADLASNRCLVPARDFALFTGAQHPKRRWTVKLNGAQLFFLAGLWREATPHWPQSYAIITIEAAPDLAPLTDRQMAVIRKRDARTWLVDTERSGLLLQALPPGSYDVTG